MTSPRKPARKPQKKVPGAARKAGSAKTRARPARQKATGAQTGAAKVSFPDAFAGLLRSRKIPVPRGLLTAAPEAYARQDASFVDRLADASDAELRQYAARVAGHASRLAERARREWESSPLIAELRRRRLPEPEPPVRPAGVSVSLGKQLGEWTNGELVTAAREWSRRASR